MLYVYIVNGSSLSSAAVGGRMSSIPGLFGKPAAVRYWSRKSCGPSFWPLSGKFPMFTPAGFYGRRTFCSGTTQVSSAPPPKGVMVSSAGPSPTATTSWEIPGGLLMFTRTPEIVPTEMSK